MDDVRRAGLDDVAEIVRLKELLMADGWPWDVNVDDAWRRECARIATELLTSSHYASFVIDADPDAGRLAGCVSVTIEQHLPGPQGTGRSAYVGDMCTDRSYRGRGYGRQLLDAGLAWASSQGAEWVSLFSTEAGRSVYLAAGFNSDSPFEHLSRLLDGS